jgi:hypothetical protein
VQIVPVLTVLVLAHHEHEPEAGLEDSDGRDGKQDHPDGGMSEL